MRNKKTESKKNRIKMLTEYALVQKLDERLFAEFAQDEGMKSLKKTKSSKTHTDLVDFRFGAIAGSECAGGFKDK